MREHRSDGSRSDSADDHASGSGAPGRRTLTQGLAPVVQKKGGDGALDFDDVVEALQQRGALPGPIAIAGEPVAIAVEGGRLRLSGRGQASVIVRFVPGQRQAVDYTVGVVNVGVSPEIRIAPEADAATVAPAVIAALTELYPLFVATKAPSGPTGELPELGPNDPHAPPPPRFLGAVRGVLELGNIRGGHVHIGSLNGALYVNRIAAVRQIIAPSDGAPVAIEDVLDRLAARPRPRARGSRSATSTPAMSSSTRSTAR